MRGTGTVRGALDAFGAGVALGSVSRWFGTFRSALFHSPLTPGSLGAVGCGLVVATCL